MKKTVHVAIKAENSAEFLKWLPEIDYRIFKNFDIRSIKIEVGPNPNNKEDLLVDEKISTFIYEKEVK